MKIFNRIKELTMKGELLNRIANILVIVFILLLLPAVISGVYNTISEGYEKKTIAPTSFQNESLVFERVGKVQVAINELHQKIGIDNTVTVYAIEKKFDKQNGKMIYYATIIANVGNPNSYKDKLFWQSQPIPEGYEYFNKQILKHGEFLVKDVTIDEKMYRGDTKMDCDLNGTRSMYGKLISKSEDEKESFFIAVGFKFTNPVKESPYFIYRTKHTTEELKKILNK